LGVFPNPVLLGIFLEISIISKGWILIPDKKIGSEGIDATGMIEYGRS
jgi:hypothetical protein